MKRMYSTRLTWAVLLCLACMYVCHFVVALLAEMWSRRFQCWEPYSVLLEDADGHEVFQEDSMKRNHTWSAIPSYDRERDELTARYSLAHVELLPAALRPALLEKERALLVNLLQLLDWICSENKIVYFMSYGTLLGSFRHHGMIPWDDDLDLAIPDTHQELVWNLLDNVGRGYCVMQSAKTQFRLFGPRSRRYDPLWEFRWPYLDIDFYSENDTHITCHHYKDLIYPKSVIFPLHRRPFHGLSLLAPRNIHRYMTLTYDDMHACSSSGLSHKNGRLQDPAEIPCVELRLDYPFVHRKVDTRDHIVVETLKLGNRSLYSLRVPGEPLSSALVDPYTWELNSN